MSLAIKWPNLILTGTVLLGTYSPGRIQPGQVARAETGRASSHREVQDKTEAIKFVADTRNAYSALRRQGLVELRAALIPNWEKMLVDLPAAKKPAAMRLARRIRFSVNAHANGTINVTHVITGPKPDKPTMNALDTMAKGVELSATGFLMTWAPFMLTHLIPDNLEHFVLQDQDADRLLSFTEAGVEVTVSIARDLEIKELKTPLGSIKPSLRRIANGFTLTGYEGNNEDPYMGHVELKAKVDLIETQGLLLPKTVFLTGSAAKTPINFELNFTNYVLKVNGKK